MAAARRARRTSVMASSTSSPVACQIASAYGGSSVHSSSTARSPGWAARKSVTSWTTWGRTLSTSTFFACATASKPGSSSQPRTTKRLWSLAATCVLLRIAGSAGSSAGPLAVRTRKTSSLPPKSEGSSGACSIAEMKQGTLVAILVASFW